MSQIGSKPFRKRVPFYWDRHKTHFLEKHIYQTCHKNKKTEIIWMRRIKQLDSRRGYRSFSLMLLKKQSVVTSLKFKYICKGKILHNSYCTFLVFIPLWDIWIRSCFHFNLKNMYKTFFTEKINTAICFSYEYANIPMPFFVWCIWQFLHLQIGPFRKHGEQVRLVNPKEHCKGIYSLVVFLEHFDLIDNFIVGFMFQNKFKDQVMEDIEVNKNPLR